MYTDEHSVREPATVFVQVMVLIALFYGDLIDLRYRNQLPFPHSDSFSFTMIVFLYKLLYLRGGTHLN